MSFQTPRKKRRNYLPQLLIILILLVGLLFYLSSIEEAPSTAPKDVERSAQPNDSVQ